MLAHALSVSCILCDFPRAVKVLFAGGGKPCVHGDFLYVVTRNLRRPSQKIARNKYHCCVHLHDTLIGRVAESTQTTHYEAKTNGSPWTMSSVFTDWVPRELTTCDPRCRIAQTQLRLAALGDLRAAGEYCLIRLPDIPRGYKRAWLFEAGRATSGMETGQPIIWFCLLASRAMSLSSLSVSKKKKTRLANDELRVLTRKVYWLVSAGRHEVLAHEASEHWLRAAAENVDQTRDHEFAHLSNIQSNMCQNSRQWWKSKLSALPSWSRFDWFNEGSVLET